MLMTTNPRDLGFLPDRLDRIGAYIQSKYLDSGKLPFGALMIGRGDEIAYQWNSGVDYNAIFRIASMTKPVTSVAFMQLVEQGKVALTHPVAKYIHEFANLEVYLSDGDGDAFVTRPAATQMRIIDLMRHMSGLTYGFQERTPVDAAYRASNLENNMKNDSASFIGHLAKMPLEFDPGSSWNYSVSTDVLGVIVERIAGQSLGDYFREHIFEPLGMADTGFQVPADQAHRLPESFAFHPTQRMEKYDPAGADSAWAKGWKFESGGGGLSSTIPDYHRFCRMLLNGGDLDGVQIISPKTLELMTANHLPDGGDLTQHSTSLFSEAENAGAGYGLGFGCTIDPVATTLAGSKGEYYWGGIFSTAFLVDPVEDLIMIFMTQLMPSMTYPIRREIRTMMYAAMAA
jgi:CubicO group peptidase (beta-lactamase class C family)